MVLRFSSSLVLFFSGALVPQFYSSLSSSLVIMVLWLTSSLVPLCYGSLILWSGSSVDWFPSVLVLTFFCFPVLRFSSSLVL